MVFASSWIIRTSFFYLWEDDPVKCFFYSAQVSNWSRFWRETFAVLSKFNRQTKIIGFDFSSIEQVRTKLMRTALTWMNLSLHGDNNLAYIKIFIASGIVRTTEVVFAHSDSFSILQKFIWSNFDAAKINQRHLSYESWQRLFNVDLVLDFCTTNNKTSSRPVLRFDGGHVSADLPIGRLLDRTAQIFEASHFWSDRRLAQGLHFSWGPTTFSLSDVTTV